MKAKTSVSVELAVLVALGWLVASGLVHAESPNVVVSLKPIHSLVAGVMEGVGKPALLVRGFASPHTYQLRPSDAAALSQADLIVWVSAYLETFLTKPLAALKGRAKVIELTTIRGLVLYPYRSGSVWEHQQGRQESEDEASGNHGHGMDTHLWLDPTNATRIVMKLAGVLAELDPDNGAHYRSNGARVVSRIEALDTKLRAQLEPVRRMPYIVFHDAYQYLEKRYELTVVGSVVLSPAQMPSVRRLVKLRDKIESLGARCLFREPQFESALVDTVVEGTEVRLATLDPLGVQRNPGPDAYFQIMASNVDAIVNCLSR